MVSAWCAVTNSVAHHRIALPLLLLLMPQGFSYAQTNVPNTRARRQAVATACTESLTHPTNATLKPQLSLRRPGHGGALEQLQLHVLDVAGRHSREREEAPERKKPVRTATLSQVVTHGKYILYISKMNLTTL